MQGETEGSTLEGSRASADTTDIQSSRTKQARRKTVACRRCHAHKIKCSGENPCRNCLSTKNERFCVYPDKDRKTLVRQSYINELLRENERLKRAQGASLQPSNSCSNTSGELDGVDANNPLIEDDAWFVPHDQSPIYIGEAACTAFSSRFQQLLLNTQAETHIPRTHYIQDSQLLSTLEDDMDWPPRPQAFLLTEFATATVGKCYHLSSLSVIRSTLERSYKETRSINQLTTCKMFGLFALGAIYSPRSSSSDEGYLPGFLYFSKARNLLRLLPERAVIDHIEVLIIFTLYSLAMNRRHCAYCYIGSAMRLALILGLHQNIPEAQLPDKAARQLRVRAWWTVYILDRMLASKVGYPTLIRDDDIEVGLPCDTGLNDEQKADFVNANYLSANARLAKVAGDIITTLYNRKRLSETFSQRVQNIFKSLRDWFATLPEDVQMNSEKSQGQVARHITLLHLSFNQCVILATRPILLHVFRITKSTDQGVAIDEIPRAIYTLAETCVHSARHSFRLLTQSWIDGSLAPFDYLSAQYLYAAAIVLAISSLCFEASSYADDSDFQSAHHLLLQLEKAGNVASKEFCQHTEAVVKCISTFRAEKAQRAGLTAVDSSYPSSGIPLPFDPSRSDGMTTEMAIFQPLVQDFLSQADTELGIGLPFDDMALGSLDLWSYGSAPGFHFATEHHHN